MIFGSCYDDHRFLIQGVAIMHDNSNGDKELFCRTIKNDSFSKSTMMTPTHAINNHVQDVAYTMAYHAVDMARNKSHSVREEDFQDMFSLEFERTYYYLSQSDLKKDPHWEQKIRENNCHEYAQVRNIPKKSLDCSFIQNHAAKFFEDYYGGELISFSKKKEGKF